MSVRINLEIGHEASIRTKRTPEGFTHDWEVFVRGCDDADIHYYVEKVVFYLHETFEKPKRVIKEPPYSVKESGYAGFQMLIDVYLRNRDQPKKICFSYDLYLQPTGPRITRVQKEKYIFNNPNDEFKYKLLKGGGVLVNSNQDNSNSRSTGSDDKPTQMTSKPKLSGGGDMKKHKMKMEEPRISDSFQELFGTPITKTSKISPDPQKMAKEAKKDIQQKSDKGGDKEKTKSKHSPYKDKGKEKTKDGDKKKDGKKRERNKDREQNREKVSKHEKSPTPRSSSPKHIPSPPSKRPFSPKHIPSPPPKRPFSPKHIPSPSPKRPSSPKHVPSPPPKRPSSPKRIPSPSPKHKEKEERKEIGGRDKEKHSEEKKSKKEKRDKEHKENRHKEKDLQKISEKKEVKSNKKELSPAPKPEKKERQKDEIEKTKNDKSEEKKHKHKKKDKDRKQKKAEKDRIKSIDKKLDKPSPIMSKEPEIENSKNLFESPKPDLVVEDKPKEKHKHILPDDSSESPVSSREPSPVAPPPPPPPPPKKETITPENKRNKTDAEKSKVKKDKKEKKNKEKNKNEKEEKKRKRKSDTVLADEPPEKTSREDSNSNHSDVEQQNQQSVAVKEVNKENQENPEDYMQILRELQRKIMTLQDNNELQKVVQLIAETGRFEVSARTFDFDLCLLERSTVRQLQEFFSSTS